MTGCKQGYAVAYLDGGYEQHLGVGSGWRFIARACTLPFRHEAPGWQRLLYWDRSVLPASFD
jgi:hypothetical protein